MINKDDIVNVIFCNGKTLIEAKVLHTPDATGDLWYFEKDGDIFAQNPLSSNFDTIIKRAHNNSFKPT